MNESLTPKEKEIAEKKAVIDNFFLKAEWKQWKRNREIIEKRIHQASERAEAKNRGKIIWSPLPDRPRYEYFDFPPSQGFWSKAPLRLRCVRAKPVQAGADLRPWLWEESQRTYGKTLSEEERREIWKDPDGWADRHFDDLAKTHGYRRPWFVRLEGRRKHPILARTLRYFWNLSLKFDPPWNHIELILTRKTAEKEEVILEDSAKQEKGGAA